MSPAWQNTSLENKYEKYFVVTEPEWHEYKARTYHVSSIGVDHSDLDKNEHYGPDLRETFYNYVNSLPYSIYSKGNMEMGKILHKVAQNRYRRNYKKSVDEYPLQRLVYNEKTKRNILLLGSADIKDQIPLMLDGNPDEPILVNLIDFKTASEYTLPSNKKDKNPTYFGQVHIYAYWLQHFYLNNKYIKIDKILIVYIDKQNTGCYEVIEDYNDEICELAWLQFVERAKTLDYHLYLFNMAMTHKYATEGTPNFRKDTYNKVLGKSLPKHEPMKWTKYSRYKTRIDCDIIFDEDIPDFEEEDLVNMFEKESGKNAVWNGKETKGYQSWKERRGF